MSKTCGPGEVEGGLPLAKMCVDESKEVWYKIGYVAAAIGVLWAVYAIYSTTVIIQAYSAAQQISDAYSYLGISYSSYFGGSMLTALIWCWIKPIVLVLVGIAVIRHSAAKKE